MVGFEGWLDLRDEWQPRSALNVTQMCWSFVHEVFFVATLSVLTKCEIDKVGN